MGNKTKNEEQPTSLIRNNNNVSNLYNNMNERVKSKVGKEPVPLVRHVCQAEETNPVKNTKLKFEILF